MFEKMTKRFASKATDGAVEGVRETLNDKFNKYSDAIFPWLVLGVVVVGTRHLTKQHQQTYLPAQIPGNGQAPIIVNNYYREREEYSYERNSRRKYDFKSEQMQHQKTGQTHSKR